MSDETRDTSYNLYSAAGLPAQISKMKPGWEVILADVVSMGAPLGLLVFTMILWLRDQTGAEESNIRESKIAAQVVSYIERIFSRIGMLLVV